MRAAAASMRRPLTGPARAAQGLSPRRRNADSMVMRIRGLALASLCVLTFGGCAANPLPESTAAMPYGIECPCCFTIVQSVRSGLLPVTEPLHVQCERCCRDLVFVATPTGQILVVTGDQAPQPAELAAPAR